MIVADVPPWLVRAFAIVFGLLVGSFLNVVIVRVPNEESVVSPPSHCICGKPIAMYDNVPILSWLALRGRARCCGARISVRYPMIEAIGGMLTWAIFEVEVLAAHPSSALAPLAARAFVDTALALALVAAAFIDLDHMFLPNGLTLGGAAVALLSAPLRPAETVRTRMVQVAVARTRWMQNVVQPSIRVILESGAWSDRSSAAGGPVAPVR